MSIGVGVWTGGYGCILLDTRITDKSGTHRRDETEKFFVVGSSMVICVVDSVFLSDRLKSAAERVLHAVSYDNCDTQDGPLVQELASVVYDSRQPVSLIVYLIDSDSEESKIFKVKLYFSGQSLEIDIQNHADPFVCVIGSGADYLEEVGFCKSILPGLFQSAFNKKSDVAMATLAVENRVKAEVSRHSENPKDMSINQKFTVIRLWKGGLEVADNIDKLEQSVDAEAGGVMTSRTEVLVSVEDGLPHAEWHDKIDGTRWSTQSAADPKYVPETTTEIRDASHSLSIDELIAESSDMLKEKE